MPRILRTPRSLSAFLFGLFVLFPEAAWAHTGVGPAHGFAHGFTHPVLGWDHLLAMVAVGLWAAQRGDKAVWTLPATFVATMVLGGILGATAVGLPGVETGILASVLVLGALVAVAARFPLALSVAVVALFALFHGHAHGTEMPATVSGFTYGIGFATATALLHAAGIAFALSLKQLRSPASPRLVRFAGAAIGLGGVALWLI